MKTRQDGWWLAVPMLLASALGLAACATEPTVPSAEIRGAREAIARAEENGAQALAPQQLQMAKDKLSRAQSAATQGDATTSDRLAEQAAVDADLAGTTANAQRIANTAAELQGYHQQQR